MRKETNFSYRYVYAGYELLLLLLLAGSGCPRLAQMAMVDAPHVPRPALALIATVLFLEVPNVAQVV